MLYKFKHIKHFENNDKVVDIILTQHVTISIKCNIFSSILLMN